MLKRFPIHRIIFLCLNIINYILSNLYEGYFYMEEILFTRSYNDTLLNETINFIFNKTNETIHINHSEF